MCVCDTDFTCHICVLNVVYYGCVILSIVLYLCVLCATNGIFNILYLSLKLFVLNIATGKLVYMCILYY